MTIHRLGLPTRDLAATARFYGETLELSVTQSESTVEVQVGPSTLAFHPGDVVPQHFAFNVADFDSAKAWLANRTPLHRDTKGQDEFRFESWRARAAYFLDPDGNILEIIAREGRPLPANGHPLKEVSEVGVACDDVTATRERLGLPPYGDPSPDFAAVGDESGLLILVARDRLWYPDTGVLARGTTGEVAFAGGSLNLKGPTAEGQA